MSGCAGCSFRGMSTAVEDAVVGVRFGDETNLTLCRSGGTLFARGDRVVVEVEGEPVFGHVEQSPMPIFKGRIPIAQFKDREGSVTVKVGDGVQVYLEQWEDDDGEIVLSKDKADQLRVWEEINKVIEKDGVIVGKVNALIKGGLAVDIGVQAFLRGSQVDLHPVRDLSSLIGKTFKFKVLKFNKKQGNIVLSRRALLEKEREKLRKETVTNLKEGDIIEGIVKNITDYGIFVDLGGIDGLLHITDISWGRVPNPSELFKVGEKIKVKVINFDRENERVSLGYKQIRPDPWSRVEEKYPVGARIKGKIVNITNYGAFIELEEGIEGLIHI